MRLPRSPVSLPSLGLTAVALATTLASRSALADNTVQRPGDHFPYFVEIEPHLDLAYGTWTADVGAGAGYGLGGRFSFTIVKNGFVPTINNSVAIGVGLDFLHFGCGGDGFGCSLNSLALPVVLQWNFYLSRDWSVFGEPGVFIYHQFFSYDANINCGRFGCPNVTETSLLPAFYVGARYKFNDRLALTMRVGYPTVSIGLSFFD